MGMSVKLTAGKDMQKAPWHHKWLVPLELTLFHPRVEVWNLTAVLRSRQWELAWRSETIHLECSSSSWCMACILWASVLFSYSKLWRRTEVLPRGRWLFGLDNDQKTLMVDLDSGSHYDLFKVYHSQDREGPSSFQLSFKEGVRSSFRAALFEPSCWKGGECNDFGLMTFSVIDLLQKYHASAFIKSITWLIVILRSAQPIWRPYGILIGTVLEFRWSLKLLHLLVL